MAKAVEAPLRQMAQSQQPAEPSEAKVKADKLAAEHKRRAQERERKAEDRIKSMGDRKEALRLKKEKQAKDREAAERKSKAESAAKARRDLVASADAERQSGRSHDQASRDRMQRVLEAQERERARADAEARLKAMRDAWKASRIPTDPYAQWREPIISDDDEVDDCDVPGAGHCASANPLGEGVLDITDEASAWEESATEEQRQLAAARAIKAVEREHAVQRILAQNRKDDPKTLKQALGLSPDSSDVEVERHMRRVLRLLHPDYSINQHLPQKQHGRVDAAFKRLNGLRMSSDR